jgi:ATP-dependent Clp protease protease subunit
MQPYVLCGEIDYETVAPALRWVASNPTSPLEIWMVSCGGDVDAAMALYAVLSNHPSEVTITVIGCAMSSAAVLLQAADVRRIHESAYIMMHRGATTTADISPDEAASTAAFNQRYYDYLDNLVYLRMKESGCKVSKKRFREAIQQSVFYTADEAMKAGLVDEIFK